jgi:hypothetical protein
MLATDTLNDGTMLGQDVVERDCRVHFKDIRRHICHGVQREKDGWVREEEERTMRCKEEEKDAKSRDRRGGMAMGDLSRTQKSLIQNLLYQEMSTRSGSNLVLCVPINFYSYTCNNI